MLVKQANNCPVEAERLQLWSSVIQRHFVPMRHFLWINHKCIHEIKSYVPEEMQKAREQKTSEEENNWTAAGNMSSLFCRKTEVNYKT